MDFLRQLLGNAGHAVGQEASQLGQAFGLGGHPQSQPTPPQRFAASRVGNNAGYSSSNAAQPVYGTDPNGLSVQPNFTGTQDVWNGNPEELQGYFGNTQGNLQNPGATPLQQGGYANSFQPGSFGVPDNTGSSFGAPIQGGQILQDILRRR